MDHRNTNKETAAAAEQIKAIIPMMPAWIWLVLIRCRAVADDAPADDLRRTRVLAQRAGEAAPRGEAVAACDIAVVADRTDAVAADTDDGDVEEWSEQADHEECEFVTRSTGCNEQTERSKKKDQCRANDVDVVASRGSNNRADNGLQREEEDEDTPEAKADRFLLPLRQVWDHAVHRVTLITSPQSTIRIIRALDDVAVEQRGWDHDQPPRAASALRG